MLKDFLLSRYVIVGVLMYVFLVVLSVFSLDVPLGEALLYAGVLTVVGVIVTWWNHG